MDSRDAVMFYAETPRLRLPSFMVPVPRLGFVVCIFCNKSPSIGKYIGSLVDSGRSVHNRLEITAISRSQMYTSEDLLFVEC